MNGSAPIGVFDSGIGGLTVVKQLLNLLPDEQFIYFGDTARVPYGSRPPEQIIQFMCEILNYFERQNVKLAVFACNTMTALGLDLARQHYAFPMIGTSTGAHTAALLTKNKRIGVLATQGTVAGGKHIKALTEIDDGIVVHPQPCPQFVPLVEAGHLDGLQVETAAREYLCPLHEQQVDTIILGCTHYPFLAPVLSRLLDHQVQLVDPAVETAQQARDYLEQHGLCNHTGNGSIRFLFSHDPEQAHGLACRLLGQQLPPFERLDLQQYQPAKEHVR